MLFKLINLEFLPNQSIFQLIPGIYRRSENYLTKSLKILCHFQSVSVEYYLMQQHIDACKGSGQTVTAYCSSHSIKTHQYYYWQNKLQPAAPGKFISIARPLLTAPVSIDFIDGTRIRFETLPSAEYIKQLMG